MRPLRALALAAVAVIAMSAPAAAVKLMVNGDTPARRWQRPFSGTRPLVPPPDGVVNLYLGPCPENYDGMTAAGCAHIGPSFPVPEVYVDPEIAYDAYLRVTTIAHELGHVFDETYLTDATRARFARIWRRPAGLRWDDEMAPVDPRAWGPDATHGITSSAREWFADTYQACMLAAGPLDRLEMLNIIDPKIAARDVAWRYSKLAKRQLSVTCHMIEDVYYAAPIMGE